MEMLPSSSQPPQPGVPAAVVAMTVAGGPVTPEKNQDSAAFGLLLAGLVAGEGKAANCQGVDLTSQSGATLTGEIPNAPSAPLPGAMEGNSATIPVQIPIPTLAPAADAPLTLGVGEEVAGQVAVAGKKAAPDDEKNATPEIDPAVLQAAIGAQLVQPAMPVISQPESGASQGNGEAGAVGSLASVGATRGLGGEQILAQTVSPKQPDTVAPLGQFPLPSGSATGTGEKASAMPPQTPQLQPADGKGGVLSPKGAEAGGKEGVDIFVTQVSRQQPGPSLPEAGEIPPKADSAGTAKVATADTPFPRLAAGVSRPSPESVVTATRTGHAGGGEAVTDPSQVEVLFPDAPIKEGTPANGEGGEQQLGEKGKEGAVPSPMATAGGSYKTPEENRVTPQANVELAKGGEHEHIMAQVKEKLAAFDARSGNGQVTLKLHPEGLGELKINVQMVDQRLKVEVVAQNPLVKEALMQNIDTLKETLSRQNIAMERFDVSTGGGQGFDQAYREGRQAVYDRHQTPYVRYSPPGEDTEETVVSYGRPRENSLVDVRL